MTIQSHWQHVTYTILILSLFFPPYISFYIFIPYLLFLSYCHTFYFLFFYFPFYLSLFTVPQHSKTGCESIFIIIKKKQWSYQNYTFVLIFFCWNENTNLCIKIRGRMGGRSSEHSAEGEWSREVTVSYQPNSWIQ